MNADGQLNDDILGNNLFTYCGNNPITRADNSGKGWWWVVAGVAVGALAGLTTKVVSNIVAGNKWNAGVMGATIGGGVYGGVLAATGIMAGTIVPTNSGWFKPQKFVSSFVGKYAIKSELQTLVQSGLVVCVEGGKKLFGKIQQAIIDIFS